MKSFLSFSFVSGILTFATIIGHSYSVKAEDLSTELRNLCQGRATYEALSCLGETADNFIYGMSVARYRTGDPRSVIISSIASAAPETVQCVAAYAGAQYVCLDFESDNNQTTSPPSPPSPPPTPVATARRNPRCDYRFDSAGRAYFNAAFCPDFEGHSENSSPVRPLDQFDLEKIDLIKFQYERILSMADFCNQNFKADLELLDRDTFLDRVYFETLFITDGFERRVALDSYYFELIEVHDFVSYEVCQQAFLFNGQQ